MDISTDTKAILSVKDKQLVRDAVRAFFSAQTSARVWDLNRAVQAALVEEGVSFKRAQCTVTKGARKGKWHPALWGAHLVLGGDADASKDDDVKAYLANCPAPAGHVAMTNDEVTQFKAKVGDILKVCLHRCVRLLTGKTAEDKEKTKKQQSPPRASSVRIAA